MDFSSSKYTFEQNNLLLNLNYMDLQYSNYKQHIKNKLANSKPKNVKKTNTDSKIKTTCSKIK